MRRTKALALVLGMALLFTGCGAGSADAGSETWTVQETFGYDEIAEWKPMETPTEGSGSGSVIETNTTDGFVTIQAAEDGWGGVESGYIELDLEKEPMIFAQVFENPDGCKWGLKVVPENATEDQAWGLYLIEDNNLKWNKYAGVKVTSVLDEDFQAVYGTKVKVKLWAFAAGGPEATVSISEIKVVNTK